MFVAKAILTPASGEVVVHIFLLDEHVRQLTSVGCVLERCSFGVGLPKREFAGAWFEHTPKSSRVRLKRYDDRCDIGISSMELPGVGIGLPTSHTMYHNDESA